jgi:hypothetical protein
MSSGGVGRERSREVEDQTFPVILVGGAIAVQQPMASLP